MSFLGIDVGTSGVKAVVFTGCGEVLAQASATYDLAYGADRSVSLNPHQVWACTRNVIAQVALLAQQDPIRALAVSALGEAVTPVDSRGNFLSSTLVAFDTRAEKEARFLGERIEPQRVFAKTGHSLHPMYTIHKIAYWKNREPEVYYQAYRFLCWQDMVNFKLGAGAVIDYSLASRTQAFNVTGLNWDQEILSAYEIDAGKLPETRQAGSVIGEVAPGLAEELGLPRGVLVVAGGFDQACAALGAGINRVGKAALGCGTVECLTVAMDRPMLNDVMRSNNFPCIPYVHPAMYSTIGYSFSGGSLIKWYAENFGRQEPHQAGQPDASIYQILIDRIADTAGGIYVLPHFVGSGTPYMDPQSKGAILGLTLKSTRGELFRAMLECISFEMRLNLELLSEAGVVIDEIIATGGGAQSALLLRMKSDLLQKPVKTISTVETGCLGCGILAATATGEFSSIAEAINVFVAVSDTYQPDPGKQAYYNERYARYKELYPALKNLNHALV